LKNVDASHKEVGDKCFHELETFKPKLKLFF
jgi:hypothetical protein